MGACTMHTPNRRLATLSTVAEGATPVALNESWFSYEPFNGALLSQDTEVGVCEELLLNASRHVDDMDR